MSRCQKSANSQELGAAKKVRKISGVAEMRDPPHDGFRVGDRKYAGDCHHADDPCCRDGIEDLLDFIGSPVHNGCYFFFRLMSQSMSEWMFRPRLVRL